MAAEMLAHHAAATEAELDAEADALGRILGARVTFIAADGRVVGDSDLNAEQLRTVENHGDAARDRRGAPAGLRRRAAPQRHDQHRHDVCRHSRPQRGDAAAGVRPPGAAPHRRRSPARLRALAGRRSGFGAGLAAGRRPDLDLLGAAGAPAPRDRRARAALRAGQLRPIGSRLRPGRDRRRGAHARLADARSGQPSGRARSGSRADGGDPVGHDRRRPRRQRARPAAARQRGGPPDAADRRRGRGAALSGDRAAAGGRAADRGRARRDGRRRASS